MNPQCWRHGAKLSPAHCSPSPNVRHRVVAQVAQAPRGSTTSSGQVPAWCRRLMGTLIPGNSNLRALAFYDRARSRNNKLRGEEHKKSSIGSLGVGLRLTVSGKRHHLIQRNHKFHHLDRFGEVSVEPCLHAFFNIAAHGIGTQRHHRNAGG